MFSYFAGMKLPTTVESTEGYRRFQDRPTKLFVDEVCAHIEKTGQPESHCALFRKHIPSDEPFHRLAKVSIATHLRPGGDMAPCPMCHSANKFKEGWLVYLYEFGATAVIGNDCASSETQAAADREWEVRKQREHDEDYLLKVVPKLGSWVFGIDRLLSVASPATEIARRLRVEGKDFFDRLRNARADGGRLKVTQVLDHNPEGPRGLRTSGSTVETADHDVAQLLGHQIVNPSFSPSKLLLEARQLFAEHIQTDEDSAYLYVADLNPELRRQLTMKIQELSRKAKSTLKELEASREFFSSENIRSLNDWGQHPFADFKFSAALRNPETTGHRRFELKGSSYFQHRIPPEFWAEIADVRFESD